MPRFYFDINDDDRCVPDEEGAVLTDVEAARMDALAVLPEIALGEPSTASHRRLSVVVRTQERAVFEADLVLTSKWLT